MLGRVRRSPRLRRLAASLGAWYIRLVDRTTRWEIPDPALRDRIRAQQERIVIAIWHGRLLMIPAEMPPGGRVHAMISANRDGDIIADCVGRFGIASMRGSSRDPRKPHKAKGGAAVAAEAMELLGEHERIAVALSPDGPRGPRMRAQPGVATVSAAMGVPVMPFAYSTNRGFVAGSWDSFFVPLPFGRGVKVWGPVIEPPEDRSPEGIEAHRLQIEQALTRITQDADRRMGRAPVEPAAPGARR